LYKGAVATVPPAPEPQPLRLPAWAWAALATVFAFVYLRGVAVEPLCGEELTAALAAHEMLARGDFVVPRVLGEPFVGQPPLPSWLVALAAGGRTSGVGPAAVRLPGLLALAGVALVVARLGVSAGSGAHALPALVLLSFALLPLQSRAGDGSLVAALLVTAALAAFELGRRRASGALQWVLAQACVAAAALTQGMAPALFHAPALVTAWRRRVRLRLVAFVAGFVVMLALVLAWVVPYARSGFALAAVAQFSAGTSRATGGGLLGRLACELGALGSLLLPWGAALLAVALPRVRALLRGLLADPWTALCAATTLWGAALFLFAGDADPSSFVPALPAAAVLLSSILTRADRAVAAAWPWAVVGAAWIAVLASARPSGPAATLAALGLLAIAAAWAAARAFGVATAGLLAAGVLYGLVSSSSGASALAREQDELSQTADTLAPYLRPEMPVVVRRSVDRRLAWLLVQRLDRVVLERRPMPPYDLVAPAEALPLNAKLMTQAGGYSVWRVRLAGPTDPTP
jgi:4-amino-4-deoxy-L-arabinose transferase-like glycosyltransferase